MSKEDAAKVQTGLDDAWGAGIEMDGASIFHALGFEDADELVIKAELLEAISARVTARGLNKTQAGKAMGLTQSESSHLLNGHIERFTIDRLVRALRHLDGNARVGVQITERHLERAF